MAQIPFKKVRIDEEDVVSGVLSEPPERCTAEVLNKFLSARRIPAAGLRKADLVKLAEDVVRNKIGVAVDADKADMGKQQKKLGRPVFGRMKPTFTPQRTQRPPKKSPTTHHQHTQTVPAPDVLYGYICVLRRNFGFIEVAAQPPYEVFFPMRKFYGDSMVLCLGNEVGFRPSTSVDEWCGQTPEASTWHHPHRGSVKPGTAVRVRKAPVPLPQPSRNTVRRRDRDGRGRSYLLINTSEDHELSPEVKTSDEHDNSLKNA